MIMRFMAILKLQDIQRSIWIDVFANFSRLLLLITK